MLNCDKVTTNMAEEIQRIGLNFEGAKKRVHGVEAMPEAQKASPSQLINQVYNLKHPAVSLTSRGDAGEAKVVAREVRRIAAHLESTNAHMAALTGRMHGWQTVPKPELAKAKAMELQVRWLMTRLDQSEHEVHALRKEIRTRRHGSPPEGMWPHSHVIGKLQEKFQSWENKYQLLKYAATPQMNFYCHHPLPNFLFLNGISQIPPPCFLGLFSHSLLLA